MRKSFAVVLALILAIGAYVPVGVYADEVLVPQDFSDYVPSEERTDNLIANNMDLNFYQAVNSTVVSVVSGETSSEVDYIYKGDGSGNGKWDNFSYYGTEGTWAKSTGGGAGQISGFNGYYPNGPENYVVEFQIRNAAPDINPNPTFTFSVFTSRAEGVTDKQIVSVTQSDDWQTVQTVFNTEQESPSSMWIAMGYGGTSSKEYPAIGTKVAFNKPSLYVAVEKAHSIDVTGEKTVVIPGDKFELNATVKNQVGSEGNLSQDFEWLALNSDRSALAEGFGFEKGEDGSVTVSVGKDAPSGKYVILASHTDEESVAKGVRKGYEIVVAPHFMEDSAPGEDPLYGVKIDYEGKTTLGIFDTLNLFATLADSTGEEGTNAQKFDWYLTDAERTSKLTDCGISLNVSEDTRSVSVSLSNSAVEGEYCIVAESVAEESQGMLKAIRITVDKSGTVDDIIELIKEDTPENIEKNLDDYIEILELTEDYISKADAEEFSLIIKSGAQKENLEGKEDLQKYFRKAALTALYNIPHESVELFGEDGKHNYETDIGADKIDDEEKGITLYSGAFAEMSTKGKEEYRNSLVGKDFETYGALFEAIKEILLLTAIANPKDEGTAYLDTVITKENLALFNIEADKYFDLEGENAKKFKNDYLRGKSFTLKSLSELLEKVEELTTEEEEEEEDNNRGSGGSKVSFGGGGGGNFGSSGGKDEQKTETASEEKEFKDVPASHWACGDIHYLRRMGIINGVTEDTYLPDAPVTREQFLKLIMEAFKLKTDSGESSFEDVDKDAWYAPYVAGGVKHAIAKGKSTDTFGVGEAITRQDACVMIKRAVFSGDSGEESLSFADEDEISDYAKTSVSLLAGYGIVNGVGENKFDPNGICTRAQAAKIIAGTLSICNSLGIGR